MTNPNAGKTSPSPNPPRSWVKYRGRRRGLRGPAALEGPAGAARSPGRRRELGRASDPTGQTPGRVTARRVPVQLPGPLGGPAAPLTSTAARGLERAGLGREGDAAL